MNIIRLLCVYPKLFFASTILKAIVELQTEVKDGKEETLLAAAADEEAIDPELVAEKTTEAELGQQEEVGEPNDEEPSEEQLNVVETDEGVPGEEHPAADEEHQREDELANGEGEDRNKELAEGNDEVQPAENEREEEEFGDGEDPEIKNVTIEDDETVHHLEGEESSQEEQKISRQVGQPVLRSVLSNSRPTD